MKNIEHIGNVKTLFFSTQVCIIFLFCVWVGVAQDLTGRTCCRKCFEGILPVYQNVSYSEGAWLLPEKTLLFTMNQNMFMDSCVHHPPQKKQGNQRTQMKTMNEKKWSHIKCNV